MLAVALGNALICDLACLLTIGYGLLRQVVIRERLN
jgi:hypothetical protein